MIEAQKLTKYYGSFQAIKDVSFKIEKGEIVGFLGPNGAGKTTTMRLLTGFIPPTSGTVRIDGLESQTNSLEVRKRIGYLPENVPLYKEMSVKAFLIFLSTLRGLTGKRREDRVMEVIQLCRLEEYTQTPISKLSKGYRQLVGFAQAIVHEPEILILDEPTIGIDPRQVVHVRQLLKEFGRTHTVILSSHILPEISLVCGRIMIMNYGKIVAVDRPENLSARIGGRLFELEIDGPEDRVLSRLKEIKSVLKASIKGKGETRRFIVESREDRDIRDELSSAVLEGGFRLLGLKSGEINLEELFLRLTPKEKGE